MLYINGDIFNVPERRLTPISRSRQYLTLNMSAIDKEDLAHAVLIGVI